MPNSQLIKALYQAAAFAGLLTEATVGDSVVLVDFRAPDEDVLDGLGVSRNYMIRFPASRLTLASGDSLAIAGQSYRVREVIALGDGSEYRATLTRL